MKSSSELSFKSRVAVQRRHCYSPAPILRYWSRLLLFAPSVVRVNPSAQTAHSHFRQSTNCRNCPHSLSSSHLSLQNSARELPCHALSPRRQLKRALSRGDTCRWRQAVHRIVDSRLNSFVTVASTRSVHRIILPSIPSLLVKQVGLSTSIFHSVTEHPSHRRITHFYH